jgi:hypothetical protein
MVDRGSGGYYALPAPRGHSSTGLALPPQEAPSLALEVPHLFLTCHFGD